MNEPIDGVLIVDKPSGPTSHDVVARVRRALGTRRVGHCGTLDPFATGVLACCVGRATRLVRFLTASDKTYEGTARFGYATDTLDRTGERVGPEVEPDLSAEAVAAAIAELTGDIEQVPPMYSAKKQGGVPLHRLARAGREVERPAVTVHVRDWEVLELTSDTLRFRVTSSAGTYVRSLVESLAARVGFPAHLSELRRTVSGRFSLTDAVALPELDRDTGCARLIPLDEVPLPLATATLESANEARAFGHGRGVPLAAWEGSRAALGDLVAVRHPDGPLLGVARLGESDLLEPTVVLVPSE